MEEFKTHRNLSLLQTACNRMLQDKYNINLDENKIEELVISIMNSISTEYSNSRSSLSELNNIALSKIKGIFDKYKNHEDSSSLQQAQSSSHSSQQKFSDMNIRQQTIKDRENFLDEDAISFKLKELEKHRKIIPQAPPSQKETISTYDENEFTEYSKQGTFSFMIPPTIDKKQLSKNLVINSALRDWIFKTDRNNLVHNININLENIILFPDVLCLPKHISMITPCVYMYISDGNNTVCYIFTQTYETEKWGMWKTTDDIENINLKGKQWTFVLKNMLHEDINLGNDALKILKVEHIDDVYNLTIEKADEVNVGDSLCIYTNKGKKNTKVLIKKENYISIKMSDVDNISIENFINSIYMNMSQQFVFIIKYHYDV